MYSTEVDMYNYQVTVDALQNKTILGVMREGVGYTEVSVSPTGRQFKYTASTGKFEFENTGSGGIFGPLIISLQKVQILYK
jgi:hypothetical protein